MSTSSQQCYIKKRFTSIQGAPWMKTNPFSSKVSSKEIIESVGGAKKRPRRTQRLLHRKRLRGSPEILKNTEICIHRLKYFIQPTRFKTIHKQVLFFHFHIQISVGIRTLRKICQTPIIRRIQWKQLQ